MFWQGSLAFEKAETAYQLYDSATRLESAANMLPDQDGELAVGTHELAHDGHNMAIALGLRSLLNVSVVGALIPPARSNIRRARRSRQMGFDWKKVAVHTLKPSLQTATINRGPLEPGEPAPMCPPLIYRNTPETMQ